MTSFLTRIKSVMPRPCLGGARPEAVVSFDVGTGCAKSAVVEWPEGRPVVDRVLCGDAARTDSWMAKTRTRGQMAVCGVNGHGVKASVHDLPRVSAKDMAALVARMVERESGGDSMQVWSVESGESSGAALQAGVLVTSAPAGLVAQTVADMRARGVDVEAVFADASSLCECLRTAAPGISGSVTALVSIGHTWSHIVIVDRGH
jgi:hypothetical protein